MTISIQRSDLSPPYLILIRRTLILNQHFSHTFLKKTLAQSLLILTLAACGGGGGSEGSTNPPPLLPLPPL